MHEINPPVSVSFQFQYLFVYFLIKTSCDLEGRDTFHLLANADTPTAAVINLLPIYQTNKYINIYILMC